MIDYEHIEKQLILLRERWTSHPMLQVQYKKDMYSISWTSYIILSAQHKNKSENWVRVMLVANNVWKEIQFFDEHSKTVRHNP